jgi:hypothetical protein
VKKGTDARILNPKADFSSSLAAQGIISDIPQDVDGRRVRESLER